MESHKTSRCEKYHMMVEEFMYKLSQECKPMNNLDIILEMEMNAEQKEEFKDLLAELTVFLSNGIVVTPILSS